MLFCLADDIMEPYRPFVDELIFQLYLNTEASFFLSSEMKKNLLSICTRDILFGKRKSPLMVGMSHTSKSLADCFKGIKRKVKYPTLLI